MAADQSGHFIDGFCGWCTKTSGEYVSQADEYFAMAHVSEEAGRLLYGLREDLDEIDRGADEEIQGIRQSTGIGHSLEAGAEIMAVIAKARADATARAAAVAAEIGQAGAQIGIDSTAGPGAGGGSGPQSLEDVDPVAPQLRDMQNSGAGPGGSRGLGGMPTGLGPKPLNPSPQPPQKHGAPASPGSQQGPGAGAQEVPDGQQGRCLGGYQSQAGFALTSLSCQSETCLCRRPNSGIPPVLGPKTSSQFGCCQSSVAQ